MLVRDAMIRAEAVTTGMRVREVFAECGQAHVQALPFIDGSGALTGRVTLKHVMKFGCLPEHMVAAAPLLGSFLSCVGNAKEKIVELLDSEVDPYVQKLHVLIRSDEPAIKALAIMEQNDTSYLFVVDDGEYQGVITIQGIAHRMSEMDAAAS
jgi:CBS domain-containing protein